MGKALRKIKKHVRRGEHFTRDHLGTHRNYLNSEGAGIRLDTNGREVHF